MFSKPICGIRILAFHNHSDGALRCPLASFAATQGRFWRLRGLEFEGFCNRRDIGNMLGVLNRERGKGDSDGQRVELGITGLLSVVGFCFGLG